MSINKPELDVCSVEEMLELIDFALIKSYIEKGFMKQSEISRLKDFFYG
jgi:hypothetical protein